MVTNLNRAEQIYNYPLYSAKRFPMFLHYCMQTAQSIASAIGCGKLSEMKILFDMIWSNFRYGIMDSREYKLFNFYHKTYKERKKYFTKRKYFKLIKTFDYGVFSRLIEKQNQYTDYSSFIHRKWMIVDEMCTKKELCDFIAEIGEVIAKPVSSDCGRGIEKITIKNQDVINRIFAGRLTSLYIIEEVVKNCKELQALNPYCLNTIRVTYVLDKNSTPNIFSVMLRTSSTKNAVVDNWGGGGILMEVEKDTGVVEKYGLDEQGNKYNMHPLTLKELTGFPIPHYKEMLQFATDVAKANSKVIYGGLDIAITDDAIELIEINFPPANIGYQVFGKGYLEEIEKLNK